jgi:predicted ArsR family transcriptional regulator
MDMTTHDDSTASLLDSPVRRAIIDALARPHSTSATFAPGGPEGAVRTAADLATLLDLHVTTVRFHLDQLDAAGLIDSEFVRTGSAGRPRKVYALAPTLLDAIPPAAALADPDADPMQILAELLTENFGRTEGDTPISPETAGRQWAETHVPATGEAPAATWGQWLGKMGRVIDVLQEWGYTPQLTTTSGQAGTRIDLTHCPFRDLARANPTVVCGIHKGLIAGTMSQVGEAESEVDQRPFADGGTCIAHLRPAPGERSSTTLNNGTIPLRRNDSRPA